MKSLIKFSKASSAVIKNKSSFFNENEKLLKKVQKINTLYLEQPIRTNCKTCSKEIIQTDLTIHEIPYSLCLECGHFNGLHQDTEEFANFLYSDDDGQNYSANYKEDYFNRVSDIYEPKVKFLSECMLSIENINKFDVTDIGCGGGHFVKALENLKIPAIGYDTNRSLIDFGSKMLLVNKIELIKFDRIYDQIRNSNSRVLSLVGVLEHLIDPIKAINAFNQSDSKYLYLQVPLFSFSALLESIHPSVFPRQLNSGHTHLYTEQSINYICNKHNLSIIGEWWFGTDMVDLYRHIQVMGSTSSTKDITTSLLGGLIDELQSVFDNKKLCSGVNMVIKKKV